MVPKLTVCAQMDIKLPVGSRFWGPILAILKKKVRLRNGGVGTNHKSLFYFVFLAMT